MSSYRAIFIDCIYVFILFYIFQIVINGASYELDRQGGPLGVVRGQDLDQCEGHSLSVCDLHTCANGGTCTAAGGAVQAEERASVTCQCAEVSTDSYRLGYLV